MRTDRSCIYNCDNNVVIHRPFETISSRRSIFFRPTFREVNYRVYRRGRTRENAALHNRRIHRFSSNWTHCVHVREANESIPPVFPPFPRINYFEFYPGRLLPPTRSLSDPSHSARDKRKHTIVSLPSNRFRSITPRQTFISSAHSPRARWWLCAFARYRTK